ncbi:MAG: D-alanyl-D-alanine carboxypeptidase/D-alanyl-D-alanine-endopeptidase [Paludibacteraceae bacterium]|nr:D-alanyl-D-alanine carboxypeptidase/D-alanyl-D-alanine-endopeptidase [Paludibacteraceae bacterium]
MSAPKKQKPVRNANEYFLSLPSMRSANIGFFVKNLNTGDTITAYNHKKLLTPASTEKLLTTATAIELFGNKHYFSTFIEYEGEIVDGVLNGNLFIRGTGDPTIGSQCSKDDKFLQRWVREVKKAGIKKIEGKVVADASFFDGNSINPQWIWEDIGNYYAPGIFAIPYLDNTLHIQLKSTAVGTVADVIKTIPYIQGLEFENHIRCSGITYDGAYVHGLPYDNKRYLVGSVPANKGIFGVMGDIPNPPLLLAQHFSGALRQAGIQVSGQADYIAEDKPHQRTLIYEQKSPSFGALIREVNIHSNNLYAEQLFRYLACRIGYPCTIDNSVNVIQSCMKNRGVNIRTAQIQDGSGLSPMDKVAPEHFVNLLTYMSRSKESTAFYQSLPIAGYSGTLSGFLAGTPLAGRVHAKSGSTSKVKAYAGYIELPDGQRWVFSVMVNNASCKTRDVQNIIANWLVRLYNEKYLKKS